MWFPGAPAGFVETIDAESGKVLCSMAHDGPILAVSMAHDASVAVSLSEPLSEFFGPTVIRAWRPETGEELPVPLLAARVDSVVVSALGGHFAVWAADRFVSSEGLQPATELFVCDLTSAVWSSLGNAPEAREAVSLSDDGSLVGIGATIRAIFRVRSNRTVRRLTGNGPILLSGDGKLVFELDRDGVHVVGIGTPRPTDRHLPIGSARTNFVNRFVEGNGLVIAVTRAVARVWSLRPEVERASLTFRPAITALAIDKQGERLVIGGPGFAAISDLADPEPFVWTYPEGVGHVAFSADGDVIAVAAGVTVRTWSFSARRCIGEWRTANKVERLALDESIGAWVVLDAHSKWIELRRVTGDRLRKPQWEGWKKWARQCEPTQRGNRAALLWSDWTVKIIDIKTLATIDQVRPSKSLYPHHVYLSDDCQRLLMIGDEMVVYDVASNEPIVQVPRRSIVDWSVMSANGRILASSHFDAPNALNVTKVDLPHNEPSTILADGRIDRAALSGDGTLLAASTDNVITIWGLDPVAMIGRIRCADAVNHLRFTPDGSRLAAVSGEGLLQVWRTSADSLLFAAEQRVTRGLTPDERRRYLGDDSR